MSITKKKSRKFLCGRWPEWLPDGKWSAPPLKVTVTSALGKIPFSQRCILTNDLFTHRDANYSRVLVQTKQVEKENNNETLIFEKRFRVSRTQTAAPAISWSSDARRLNNADAPAEPRPPWAPGDYSPTATAPVSALPQCHVSRITHRSGQDYDVKQYVHKKK